ncbi:hypothetical protein CPAR01_14536 [Colletotrichum paranaense]|uniref:Uncharacterized protein n=1 Tax=Colletotrichum paranaense TaxID=1914294 RepID=A0ABQ9S0Q3_9PEZI|nr:uncharacterized protein CPAR01_14536 [Colletotrichum paranaense]KAK1521619.1 hypothetical protein CPAR01_14536 [Colletotrichum paranaense]
MGSKCWFVLSQTHYPPPEIPKTGFGPSRGPICLGHLIPDLRHLDNIINRDEPLDIPPNMPIHPSKAWGLNRQMDTGRGAEITATASAPIAAAAGVTLKLDAGFAFDKSVSNHWEFEALETFIIQPTNNFVEESVSTNEVRDHLKKQAAMVPTLGRDALQLANHGLRTISDTVSELFRSGNTPKAFLVNLRVQLVFIAEWLKETRGLELPNNVDRVLKLLALLEELGQVGS